MAGVGAEVKGRGESKEWAGKKPVLDGNRKWQRVKDLRRLSAVYPAFTEQADELARLVSELTGEKEPPDEL